MYGYRSGSQARETRNLREELFEKQEPHSVVYKADGGQSCAQLRGRRTSRLSRAKQTSMNTSTLSCRQPSTAARTSPPRL